MKNRIVELAIGPLFGLGLILSGLSHPGKAQGFLDGAGAWDPSLTFAMGGALLVGPGAYALDASVAPQLRAEE